jgi:Ulp1 family protease
LSLCFLIFLSIFHLFFIFVVADTYTKPSSGLVVVRFNGVEVTVADVQKTMPGIWFNDVCINHMMALLDDKSVREQLSLNAPRKRFLSSFFFSQLAGIDTTRDSDDVFTYENVHTWTDRVC